jgi:hypothetical protein
MPGGGERVARVTGDADELGRGKKRLHPREQEGVLGTFLAHGMVGVAATLLPQGEQDRGAQQRVGLLAPRQRIALEVLEGRGVLVAEHRAAIIDQDIDWSRQLVREQALAAARHVRVSIQQLLNPGGA